MKCKKKKIQIQIYMNAKWTNWLRVKSSGIIFVTKRCVLIFQNHLL